MQNKEFIINKIFQQSYFVYLVTDSLLNIIFYSEGFKKIVDKKKWNEGESIFSFIEIRDKKECLSHIRGKIKTKIKVKIIGNENKFVCNVSRQNIKGEGVFYLFLFNEVEKTILSTSSQIILDAIPMPTFFENEVGEIINCNLAFEKLVQKPRHILISNKKKSKKTTEICEIEAGDKNSFKTVSEEKIIVDGFGEKKVYILVKSPYLTESMKYGGKVGLFNDITHERDIYEKLIINENKTKEAELLFRSLWENSLDGFRLVDKKGNIKLVNDAYCSLVDKNRDELLDNLFTIVYSEQEKRIFNRFKQRFKNHTIKEHSEDFVKLWNGKNIWLESLNKIIFIKEIPYVLSIFRDVSKRHVIEDELKNYLNFEALISNLNKNYLQASLENINDVFKKNLEEIGKYLKISFAGLFLKKGNRLQLSEGWYDNDNKRNKTFFENNNVIANLKINKLLREKNIINIEIEDEKLLQEYRILKNDLMHYKVNFLTILPLIINDVLIGFIGMEGCENKLKELNVTVQKLKTISDNFTNLLIRNKNIKLIKREKEELETILQNIIDGVITTNRHEVIVHANDAIYNILEKEKGTLIGRNMRFFASMFLQPKDSEYREESIRFYNFITSFQKGTDSFKLFTNKGEIKIINVSITELYKTSGENDGYIYIIWDMTEKINIEKKVAFSQKMEAIGQLSAGIAHEINTPMQYINDNNRFLSESLQYFTQFVGKLLNNEYSNMGKIPIDYIEKIINEMDLNFYLDEGVNATNQSQTGIEKVINIIKVMKDFSHPGKVSKSLTCINNCIDVSTAISKNAWKYFAELELRLDENIPKVICNAQEINQVLLNIIVNSAQAIEEAIKSGYIKKGHILIETNQVEESIEIKISDNGIGIKKENLEKIFDMFFTTKEVGKGTGQGLAISYDIIINKHGGKIEVDSKFTQGTTFRIYLPLN